MQRRDMMKKSLFGIGAVAAVGVAETATAAPAKKRAEEEWDVVVVGAGFAGMCAALEASEKGAKVVLLEKNGTPRRNHGVFFGLDRRCGKPLSEEPSGRQ